MHKQEVILPKVATVEREGQTFQVPVEDVQIGDILIVKAGASIPVDGTVVEGNASVDESALTGESIPVGKHIGDKVIGATINKSGFLKMQATKVGDDTTLAQIIRLVDEVTSSKAPTAKLADKVSGVFVPIVIVIAVIATLRWLIAGYSLEFALSIGIPVAAGLFFLPFALKLNPMIGAFAMSFSSVFVVTNALRLRWFKPKRISNKNNSTAEIAAAQIDKEGENPMEKILKIEGMMCNHCVMHIQKVLSAVPGVAEVTVSLEEKNAKVKLNQNVTEETLKVAIEGAGYQLTEIA